MIMSKTFEKKRVVYYMLNKTTLSKNFLDKLTDTF